jgi:hypothetical protein
LLLAWLLLGGRLRVGTCVGTGAGLELLQLLGEVRALAPCVARVRVRGCGGCVGHTVGLGGGRDGMKGEQQRKTGSALSAAGTS